MSRNAGSKIPPSPHNAFGNAIVDCRQNMIRQYSALAGQQGLNQNAAAWFLDHRSEIEKPGLNPFAQAASLKVVAEYERDPACIEALGALNRWPGRTRVPIEEYFPQWEASYAELQASPRLPNRLREMLGIR
jgi:hypothetical protein